jgi:hypothetical protein
MKINDEIFVDQISPYEGLIVDSHHGERAVITHIGDISPTGNHDGRLCYVKWIDRPMEYRKDSPYRPFAQLWLFTKEERETGEKARSETY